MKISKFVASLVALFALFAEAHAQDLKFAHINSQQFLSELQEFKDANVKMQEEATKLEEQIKVMQNDIQQKYAEYMEKRDSLPELIRATKEKEIQDASERMQSFQQLAQQSLQQKEQQLLQPILEKYQKAVEAVGKENNFTYIFDKSSQVILFESDQSTDISALVKAKLESAK